LDAKIRGMAADVHQHCGHGHHHHAHSARGGTRRRVFWSLVLAGGYTLAEVIGGVLTNSLALLADAGHMLSDVAALGLALFAFWIAERPPSAKQTYGFYRAEILAALANGAALVAISVYIFIEAYSRLREPPAVMGAGMLAIATGGLFVNLLQLWLLGHAKEYNLNVRGAWLHVLTDALGSVVAMAAGGLIWSLGWNWVDPVVSALIGLLVIYSSWQLLAESVSVLMESVPHGIDVDAIRMALLELPGVRDVHDLHVWSITTGMDSLSAHVVTAESEPHTALLTRVRQTLHDRFGIDHMTIQIEPERFEERGIH